MSKISIEDVQSALQAIKVDPKQQEAVLKYLNQVVQEIQEEKENNKEPKVKKEFGVLIIDELGEVKTDNISALVYQINVGDDHNEVPNKIRAAVNEFNETEKGKKDPIKSISQAFCYIAPKYFKKYNLVKKTKELCFIIKSNNKLF